MDIKINWEVLSVTRFLLAMIVLLGHLQGYTEIGFLKYYTFLGSFEAILGFLLISGLSIGHSIKRNKNNYYKRRVQRIYPVYLASLVYQILLVGLPKDFESIGILLLNIVFLNQIFTSISVVGPAWTLATEVFLYSLAPIFLLLKEKTLFILIFISFFTYLFYTAGRTLFHWDYYSTTKYGLNVICLSFIWIAGFALAILPEHRDTNKKIIIIILTCHLLSIDGIQILFRLKHHQLQEIFYSDIFAFIGTFFCLAWVFYIIFRVKKWNFNSTTRKIFDLLGNISYPLYLTHLTSFSFLKKLSISNPTIYIFSSIMVATIIYLVFDFYSKKRVIKIK